MTTSSTAATDRGVRGVVVLLSLTVMVGSGCEQILGIHDLRERPSGVELAIEPAGTQDFGSVTMGAVSAPVSVTITNQGSAPSAEVTVEVTGDDADAFVLAASACNRVLAPEDSCSAELRFRPTRSASQVASLRAVDGSGADAEISLLGLGLVPLVALPGDLSFGNVLVGNVSVEAEIQVINIGGTATGAVTAGVTSSTHFEIVAGQNMCQGEVLDPGESCSLRVRFRPMEAGDQMTGLLVSAPPLGTITAPLTGTGLAPGDVEIDPTDQDFGAQLIGSNTLGETFVVTNSGTGTTGVLTSEISNSVFVQDNGCDGMTLANNDSCTISVTFDPQVAGFAVGSLTVLENGSPVTAASLSGTGTANLTVNLAGVGGGTVTSAPAGIDCGAVCSHAFSVSQVTLTATPVGGSTFGGWSGGGCSGINPSCQVPMDQAQAVTATFTTTMAMLTVQVLGDGFGRVTSGPPVPLNCNNLGGPSSCNAIVTPGTMVMLFAMPDPGQTFVGWCGVCIDEGTDPSCAVIVNGNVNVQAYFCPMSGPQCGPGC